jgi:hypothetical protein
MSKFDLDFDKAEVFCAWCRRLKDDKGMPYGEVFSDTDPRYLSGTHGICIPCMKKQSPEVATKLGYL